MQVMKRTESMLRAGKVVSARSLEGAAAAQAHRGPALAAAIKGLRQEAPEPVAGQAVAGEISTEQRLLLRATMGFTQAEADFVEQLGYYRYLDLQVKVEPLNDGPLEEILYEFLPSINLDPAETFVRYQEEPETPILELLLATILRSLYSPRQLYERMTVFWTDHFNIDLFDDIQYLFKSTDHREVIRRHAMGTFPELLSASAHSPSMLLYLTNASNVKGHANENYARELMELHTMGPDNGYTQEDVKEVARCFTGWTVSDGESGIRPGLFHFAPELHDNGAKVVLGQTIPAGGGIRDGERVLEILATHPNTARFISTKMIRYFLDYEPPASWVDRLAQVYLDTGGDIRTMLREVLKRRWVERATPKLKRPYHLATSMLRGLGAEIGNPFYLLTSLLVMGQLPFNWAPPNGYPDSAGYWSGYLLPRWNFAEAAMTSPDAAVALDIPLLNPSLPANKLMHRMDWLLFNHTLPVTGRRALLSYMSGLPAGEARVRQGLGLALATPQFQEY